MLAVNTVIFFKYPLEIMLRRLQDLGIKHIELSYSLQTEKYGRCIKEVLRDYGMEVVGYGGAWMPEDNPYGHGGKKRSIRCLENNIKIASAMGASFMTVCEDVKPEGVDEAAAWRTLIDVFKESAKIAGDYNIILTNEFHPGFFAGTPEQAIKLLDEVGSQYFKACIDLCHADIMTEGHIPEFIRKLGRERIGHIHLGDGSGAKYMHMPLGEGKIDIKICIENIMGIGYNGVWSLCLYGYPFPERGVKTSIDWFKKERIIL